jgi:CHAT domain-containing protein
MARKWSVFQFRISPFLKGISRGLNRHISQLLIGVCLGLWLSINLIPVMAESYNLETPISQLQRESQSDFNQGKYEQAAQKLKKIIASLTASSSLEQVNLAIAWTNLGNVQLAAGQSEAAIKSWGEAIRIYEKLNYKKPIPNLLISQAQAWKKLGLNLPACAAISQGLKFDPNYCQRLTITETSISKLISDRPDLEHTTYFTGWRLLADVFQNLGRLSESQIILEKVAVMETDTNPSATFTSLGNTLKNLGDLERDRQSPAKLDRLPWRCETTGISQEIQNNFYQPALTAYQKASPKSQNVGGILNQASLLIDLNQTSAAEKLLTQIKLDQLKLNQDKVYAQINYARSLACIEQSKLQPNWKKVETTLSKAVQDAKSLKFQSEAPDSITLSYALGSFGSFYEYLAWRSSQDNLVLADKNREKALSFSESALYLAQPTQSPELAYEWQWQIARLLASKGDTKMAINNYQAAVKTLETVRRDLIVTNRDVQFSFRDRVEPLYRELVGLLLTSSSKIPDKLVLNESIQYLQSLEIAELENFLQCQLLNPKSVTVVDPNAAIIYPIVLKNRLVTILSLPKNKLRYYVTNITSQEELETTVNQLRQELNLPGERGEVLTPASKVYDWLIKPLKADLQQNPQINTLVFVPDSSFRNIPMGVLYDRENRQYLLQKYAVAVSPGLQLLSPRPLSRGNLTVLAAGISEPIKVGPRTFPSLPQVNRELEAIGQNFSSELLINQKFTLEQLRQEVNTNNFSVVHLATHGEFNSDPDKTFILTYQNLLKAKDLRALLINNQNQKITPDLLVLSACNTAIGDRRSTLGLAGIAVSSGASSTLATLWSVNDLKSAELMIQFYNFLQKNPQLSKAKALQQAQLKLLETEKDPFYWASYILVGNWL